MPHVWKLHGLEFTQDGPSHHGNFTLSKPSSQCLWPRAAEPSQPSRAAGSSGPRPLYISSRLEGASVSSIIPVEAETVVTLSSSMIPPLIHALAPILGLQPERATPQCLFEVAIFVLSRIPRALDHPFWGPNLPISEAHRLPGRTGPTFAIIGSHPLLADIRAPSHGPYCRTADIHL